VPGRLRRRPSAWTRARGWPDAAGQGDHQGVDRRARLPHPRLEGADASHLGGPAGQTGPRRGWSHEEFLAPCLQREVAAREAHGGEGRIRAARFPARKNLEEFDHDHARGLKRDLIAHLGTLDFVTARENVVFLGLPGTGKTHLAIGPWDPGSHAGHRVLFASAAQLVARLADAHAAGRLQAELLRLGSYPLLVVDEVGYLPFAARPPTCSSSWSRPATSGPA
jgi:DNA replication protein DnaC